MKLKYLLSVLIGLTMLFFMPAFALAADPMTDLIVATGMPLWLLAIMAIGWLGSHVAAWTKNDYDNRFFAFLNMALNKISGNYGNAKNKNE